jgi:hypothetical protein
MLLQRFAAGAAVASAAIALAAFAVLLTPRLTFQKIYPLTIVWCFVPLAWGLWALLTPSAWMPKRLPLWGTILGVIGGSLAAFVLNLPSRILGEELSLKVRGFAVLVIALFYYALWTLVRAAYRRLAAAPARNQ